MKKFLLGLLVIPTLVGCEFSFSSNPKSSSKEETSSAETTSSSSSKKSSSESKQTEEVIPTFDFDDKDYCDFFNHGNKVDMIIEFSNVSANKLNDYGNSTFEKTEMYHPAKLTIKINGEERFVEEEVGARMKGNTSRTTNFVPGNDGNIYNLCHFKLSFAQTFDDKADNDYYIRTWENSDLRKARKDRRFGQMKKLDLKWNRNQDSSFAKEPYALDCFEQEGLVAQKSTLVNLTIKTENDSKTEIYEALETVDKELLKKHYEKAAQKGNLYKSCYTAIGKADLTSNSIRGIGIESASMKPIYDLKTNDDPEEIDHTVLTNLITKLNKKTNAAESKAQLDELVDVDYNLRYLAMLWIVGNPDDFVSNTNNTYIYFNSVNNKMTLIPYDNDRCFGILESWPIDMSGVYATTTKRAGADRSWIENPLLWKMYLVENDSGVKYSDNFACVTEYREKFLSYCEEFQDKYLVPSKFQEFVNEFKVDIDKDISHAGGSNQTFAYYCSNKKGKITY